MQYQPVELEESCLCLLCYFYLMTRGKIGLGFLSLVVVFYFSYESMLWWKLHWSVKSSSSYAEGVRGSQFAFNYSETDRNMYTYIDMWSNKLTLQWILIVVHVWVFSGSHCPLHSHKLSWENLFHVSIVNSIATVQNRKVVNSFPKKVSSTSGSSKVETDDRDRVTLWTTYL